MPFSRTSQKSFDIDSSLSTISRTALDEGGLSSFFKVDHMSFGVKFWDFKFLFSNGFVLFDYICNQILSGQTIFCLLLLDESNFGNKSSGLLNNC